MDSTFQAPETLVLTTEPSGTSCLTDTPIVHILTLQIQQIVFTLHTQSFDLLNYMNPQPLDHKQFFRESRRQILLMLYYSAISERCIWFHQRSYALAMHTEMSNVEKQEMSFKYHNTSTQWHAYLCHANILYFAHIHYFRWYCLACLLVHVCIHYSDQVPCRRYAPNRVGSKLNWLLLHIHRQKHIACATNVCAPLPPPPPPKKKKKPSIHKGLGQHQPRARDTFQKVWWTMK